MAIVKKGSTKSHLQTLALEMFKFCSENKIFIEIVWIPTSDNSKADYISKMIDHEDWQTTSEFFEFVDHMWGTFTVDRFANNYNCKVQRFNSKFWNVNTAAIDAFSQNWYSDNNWLVRQLHMFVKRFII